MSLVAYDYSSDENSDQEDEDESPAPQPAASSRSTAKSNGSLPAPVEDNKPDAKVDPIEDEEDSTVHLALPAPKKVTNDLNIEEEDDEFLRKKAIPEEKPTPLVPLNITRSNVRNGKVQITIPSLKSFKNDEDDCKPKAKPIIGAELPKKPTMGLLGMLPKPKSEMGVFGGTGPAPAGQNGSVPAASAPKPIANRLIPDSVANRPRNVQPAQPKAPPTKKSIKKPSEEVSDESDDEGKLDFFSLNADEKLPEISANEISAMVAKRAARMAEAVKKFDEPEVPEELPGTSGLQPTSVQYQQQLEHDLANERALSSLIGGNKAKRARLDEVNIIDISSADIVPSRDDFMRRKLQDETGYVPTGHLTGDWTCTSKRKSHITHLASKAQANAQELEAMWAANRQSKRATQSKYGF